MLGCCVVTAALLFPHHACDFPGFGEEKSDEAGNANSRLAGVSGPHAEAGKRCDEGGVCKAERAALLMWCEM